jgi:hypothetical protein
MTTTQKETNALYSQKQLELTVIRKNKEIHLEGRWINQYDPLLSMYKTSPLQTKKDFVIGLLM